MIKNLHETPVALLCEPEDEAVCLECVCYECPVITCEMRRKNWSENCSKTGESPMSVCAMAKAGEAKKRIKTQASV